MSKVVLHFGLHKTGTSAIQRFMSLNRDELKSNGILYPDTEPFEAHHKLSSRLLSDLSVEDKQLDVERTFGSWKALGYGLTFFSSEMISEGVSPKCFLPVQSLFEEVSFLFYVRDQLSLYESAYNQQVKQNGEYRKINQYKPYMLDIYSHIMSYKSLYPDADFILREYDRNKMIGGNVVDDLLVNVLRVPTDADVYSRPVDVNMSLSPVACCILARVNGKAEDSTQRESVKAFLSSRFSGSEYRGYTLVEKDLRDYISQTCKLTNASLAREFGFDAAEFLMLSEDDNKIFLSDEICDSIISSSGLCFELSEHLGKSQSYVKELVRG